MKLAVASTFPIYPPRGGGQQRIFGLYRALAECGIDVDVVALADPDTRAGRREVAPGLYEIRVPKTREHAAAEAELERVAGIPVTDVAMALHHALTPAYAEALAAATMGAFAVVASHPFTQPAIAEACSVPLIYEAHNVELDLKGAMTDHAALLAEVERVEAACCDQAEQVIVCSLQDAQRLATLYGLDPDAAVLVPNGVDPSAVTFVDPAGRAAAKARLGLADIFQALFLGSWHEPNLVAVRDVFAAAELQPDVRYLVVGSAGLAFAGQPVPHNVDLCGVVSVGFVRSVLMVADAALNPMRAGSGTNLKMLDYALAGVPLVSTPFGARGLGLNAGEHYIAMEPDELAAALDALRRTRPDTTAGRVRAAHDHVREHFTWDTIARRWAAQLQAVHAL